MPLPLTKREKKQYGGVVEALTGCFWAKGMSFMKPFESKKPPAAF